MVEIELKYLRDAVSKLSDAFSPEDSPALSLDNLKAVTFDFLSYQLKQKATLKNFSKIINKLSKKQRPIFLIEIGILSNPDVLPTIIESLKEKSASDYIIINKIAEIAKSLADIVPPKDFIFDSERGEEIVRKLARDFNINIAGETAEESAARLLQVDSLEIQNVKEQIEIKIRKALEEARRKAKAAAKITRE